MVLLVMWAEEEVNTKLECNDSNITMRQQYVLLHSFNNLKTF
jgi:hypothetical protein